MTASAGERDPLPTLAALFTDADDPIVVTAGRTAAGDGPSIVFANAAMARLTGETAASLVGRGCLALLDPITDPLAHERLIAGLDSDAPLRADVWARRADSAPRPSRWELLPLRDADGAVTHRVIIVHDLTAQRLAEQARTDLATTTQRAGHDLNNTITGLIVNLSLLNGSGLNEAQRESCLTDALDAAREGARTIRWLLETLHRLTPGVEPGSHAGSHAERAGPAADDRLLTHPASEGASERLGAHLHTVASGSTAGAGPIDLAARAGAPLSAQIAGGPPAVPGVAPRARLLLLDDDEKLLRMMAGFLERAGFDVTATAEPRECIARYRERRAFGGDYDLVILDLTVDDGRDEPTLEALKAIDPRVRAVAHSGHPFADAMTTPRAHGFLAAIQKPTPLSSLAATIDALLRDLR